MSRNGVYLYGYYGQGNLGDDLLMTSAVQMIRAVRLDAPVFLHCHDPARMPLLNDPLLVPVPANARLANTAVFRPLRLKAYFSDLRTAFLRSDALVFGGGTVFQDTTSPVSLLIISATVILAKRMGLKVIAIGSGVGDIRTSAGQVAMKAVLNRADVFCVRDDASLVICRDLAPKATLRQTADLVYSLKVPQAAASVRSGIALSIQPSVTSRNDEPGRRSRNTLRGVIEAAVHRGETCTLLAFETKLPGHGGRDDRDAWNDVAGDLMAAHPALIGMLALAGSIDDVIAIMTEARVHYGMRYHGHVLAALAGTPFAGLAHDVKVQAVCQSFGMPCLDVSDATPEHAVRDLETAAGMVLPDDIVRGLRGLSTANIDALRDGLGKTS
jgi:polysaccharide pyruvyl transferase WcaK-like protein